MKKRKKPDSEFQVAMVTSGGTVEGGMAVLADCGFPIIICAEPLQRAGITRVRKGQLLRLRYNSLLLHNAGRILECVIATEVQRMPRGQAMAAARQSFVGRDQRLADCPDARAVDVLAEVVTFSRKDDTYGFGLMQLVDHPETSLWINAQTLRSCGLPDVKAGERYLVRYEHYWPLHPDQKKHSEFCVGAIQRLPSTATANRV